MPRIKQGTPVPAASVASYGAKQSLFARIRQKVVCKFGSLETIADICNVLHTKGEENSQIRRVFFISVYIGSILPCGALMRPLPFVGVGQRVGVEPFYLHIVKLS